MELAIVLPVLAGVGILLAAALRLLRRAKARYRELLGEVQAVRREVAVLRREVALRETAARVERAAATGNLSRETSRRLLEYLSQLTEEAALQGRPY